MTIMSDAIREFLDKPHFAVVATLSSDGCPTKPSFGTCVMAMILSSACRMTV